MNTVLVLLTTAAAIAAASGCSRSAATTAEASAPAPAPAATYKAGRGLQLSPAATAFVGLQTADVGARDLGGAKGVAAIPADALLRTAKGNFVYVANGGWLLRTPVNVGAAEGAWLPVKDGLYEGDVVVTQGVRALWLAEIQAVNGGVACTDGH
ncbi:MAG: hypothetical protein WCQ89_12885 [Verrucomicrobiota bacterium]